MMVRSPILDNFGIRYCPDDLLWTVSANEAGVENAIHELIPTAQVAKSKTLFLERGSDAAGLRHMWLRHAQEFSQLLEIDNENQLQQYLHKIMLQGEYYIGAYKTDSRGGLEIVYIINEKLYLHVAIGSNGFIVTAYPTTKNMSYYDSHGYQY